MTLKPTVTILLSRQPLRPCSQTGWIRQSQAAVRRLKEDNYTLLSSVGMATWEMLTALASLHQMPLKLYLPAVSHEDFLKKKAYYRTQFDLADTLTEYMPVIIENRNKTKEEIWTQRDKRLVGEADLLLPVSIKEGGHISDLIKACPEKKISFDYKIDYEYRGIPLAYEIERGRIKAETAALAEQYLIHWTRTANTAWPEERLLDYYRDILKSEEYPRNARATLLRILTDKKIYASKKNMPARTATVSFSALSPLELQPLMKWRARYRQMAFEPYGLGIKKETALRRGVVPVGYYDRLDNRKKEYTRDWRYQSTGRITDWRNEKEYRFKGDFCFDGIANDDLIAVCRYGEEARMIETVTGIKTFSFTE